MPVMPFTPSIPRAPGKAAPRRRPSPPTLLRTARLCATTVLVAGSVATGAAAPEVPQRMICQALQTAGLHDNAGAPEEYEAATFYESKFELRINKVLMQHLAEPREQRMGVTVARPDLYLTLLPRNDPPMELNCRQVRHVNTSFGYSCLNTPPSELLLLNPTTRRFTRSSIAGWTFTGQESTEEVTRADSAAADGQPSDAPTDAFDADTLFVEYGTCSPR